MKKSNKHVFFFFQDESDKGNSSKPLIKRFVSLDFLGINEINITNKIKTNLPQLWDKHFYLFDAVETMKIGALDNDSYHLQSFKELKVDGSALTWYKPRQLVYMDGYLQSLSCSRKYILFLLNFYRRLLKSIDLLVASKVVHNNIGFKSIVIDNSSETPILTNFRFGLDISSKSQFSMFFIQYAPDRIQWPLEIHLLCYLQTNKLEGLSFHNIELVVKSVINENHYLKTFGPKIVDEYLESGLAYFSRYINKSVDWIVVDMLQYAATWDNYALSIAYLKIIIDLYSKALNNISRKNSKSKANKSKFLIQFMRLLVTNIHSNPLKRLCVKDTTNKFAILMEECSLDDLYLLVVQ